ncbi:rna-binding la domain protein [Lasallia pustulata]|uniref:Rna-binding la domain protein n=1 Tax=Lasallia pustulata TaxID=136370 RepID=A0A1W5CSK8_9LECA|nr:rna-binding la domain protein [Lasallia pustulata]
MVELKTESTEPDPSAISLPNDETINTENAAADTDIPKEAHTGAAPTLEEVTKVIDEVEKQEAPNGSSDDIVVKTGGHEVTASEGGADAEKKDSNGEAEQTESGSHREDNHRNSHKTNKKYNSSQKPYKDFRNNVKSDLTGQEESSDPVEIRKQVEFYFSDSNLPMDNFLFGKVMGHKNLPVPISIIHSFKRMRHFQPFSAVVAALKDSTILDVVDSDTCIQRKVPLPEDIKDKPVHEVQKVFEDAAMARSIYAKGFGEEKPSTQFDIEAFFAPYGPTNSVRLRRDNTRSFKGSVFVEFDSEATQKAFLALDPQPKWQGQDLQIKSKKQYCDEKVEEIAAGRLKPNMSGREKHDRHNKMDRDDRDWNTRRDEDRKNGFKDDRRGGHKGFGSSGQRGRGRGGGRGGGKGGGRGGRGPRDRNQERARDKDEHAVPTIAATTTSPAPATESTAPDSSPAAEAPSKKRAREDDDDDEAGDRAAPKKVDVKEEQA